MNCEKHMRGVVSIKENLEQRAEELALYLIENRTTVRAAAKKFGISKSTVHKDLSERLPLYNRPLWLQVKEILEENKAQRHIRGGMATRRKYRGESPPARKRDAAKKTADRRSFLTADEGISQRGDDTHGGL